MAVSAQLWRDRIILLGGLACVSTAAWFMLAHMNASLAGPRAPATAGMLMTQPMVAPGPGYGMTLAMWATMMMAMMAPATAPGATAYLALSRRRAPQRSALLAATAFLVGYFATWLAYAALAAAAQSTLARAMVLTSMGTLVSSYVASAVLITAGAYQLTPIKHSCITRCRNPLLQLMGTWHNGLGGALRLGLGYGSWCVGCCWALMALMFVAGVMNLAWMALMTVFFFAEKLVPPRWHVDLIAGVLLVASGCWMALTATG